MSFRRAAFLLGGMAGAAGIAGSCSAATEVIVVVDGDVRDADTVVVRIATGNGFERVKEARLDRTAFPLTLGVAAGEDEGRSFTVTATAARGNAVVVSRTTRARLVAGESRVLVVSLCAACAGRVCEGETTCGPSGNCEPISDARDLPEWNGTPPRHRCGGDSGDGGVDGDADLAGRVTIDNAYYLIDDPRNWTSFDLKTVDANLVGYAGAAYDGAFVYLSPQRGPGGFHGRVARYDTGKPFTEKASWSSFDLTTLDVAARGYGGAATFADDYVYFPPNADGNDVVPRYHVGMPFTDPKSWSTFRLGPQPVSSGQWRLGGAVVNYSHVWMTSRDPGAPIVLKDNRPGNEAADAGWQNVTPRTLDAGGVAIPGGYFGGAFNRGRKMYFAPSYLDASRYHGVAMMRDLDLSAGDVTKGWFAFDIATLSPNARGYAGAVFDGRYVTFVPSQYETKRVHGFAARVDTLKPFDQAASWEIFDLTTVQPELFGFIGGVFDGRFVYFVPAVTGTTRAWIVRYDTRSLFTDAKAWSYFDVKRLPSVAAAPDAFHGAAFDGKYIYLVPYGSSPVLRFEARVSVDREAVKYANGSFL